MHFIACIGWYFVALLYRIYDFIVTLAWACRGEMSAAYLVDATGSQLRLTEWNCEMCEHPAVLLIIFYTRAGLRYRFVELDAGESALEVLPTVRSWTAPASTIFGLKVDIKDHEFVLDPREFSVLGNKLFTTTFNRWMCLHYFHIPATDEVKVTVIDESMTIRAMDAPVMVTENGLMPWLVDRAMAVLEASQALDAEATTEAFSEPSAEANAEPSGEANAEPSGEANAEPSGEANAEPSGEANAEPSAALVF